MCEPNSNGIQLDLTAEQGNLILEGLAELPFKQVFELIGHLNQQAQAAFAAAGGEPERVHFVIGPMQMRLILSSLGQMPFNRVNQLLRSMHQQMRMRDG
jgi:Mg/Co/Ni transporter MgtE